MSWLQRIVDGLRAEPGASPRAGLPDLDPALSELLEEPLPPAPEPVDELELLRVAGPVRAHFRANLPEPTSLPGFAMKVMALVEDPEVDLFELSTTIEQDPAIAVKILQVANSAFYRTGEEIATVRAAVSRLGLFAVANLAVSVACRTLFDAGNRAEYELFSALWNRLSHDALTTAFSASELASRHRLGRPDHAFFGGLFHDIGKSLGLRSIGALIVLGDIEQPPPRLIEHVLERLHVDLGSTALERWQLPAYLANIALRHHMAEPPTGTDAIELHLVRVASGLNALRVDPALHQGVAEEVRRSAQVLGTDAEALRATAVDIREVAQRVASIFALPEQPAETPVRAA